MISIGVEEGVFQMKENKMIQNLIKLDKVKSQSIMTPRTVVATAPESMSLKEFYQDGKYKFYSRIPIYNDSEDYITFPSQKIVLFPRSGNRCLKKKSIFQS